MKFSSTSSFIVLLSIVVAGGFGEEGASAAIIGAAAANVDEDQRDLQQSCEPAAWHAIYSDGWDAGRCEYSTTCDSPPFDTNLECCNEAFAGQLSGYCVSQLANPPSVAPTSTSSTGESTLSPTTIIPTSPPTDELIEANIFLRATSAVRTVEPGKCPEITEPFLCSWRPDACAKYQMKRTIMTMKASKKNLLFFFYTVIAAATADMNQNNLQNGIDAIQDNRSTKYYECIRTELLIIYCAIALRQTTTKTLLIISEAFHDASKVIRIQNAIKEKAIKAVLVAIAEILKFASGVITMLTMGYYDSHLYYNLWGGIEKCNKSLP